MSSAATSKHRRATSARPRELRQARTSAQRHEDAAEHRRPRAWLIPVAQAGRSAARPSASTASVAARIAAAIDRRVGHQPEHSGGDQRRRSARGGTARRSRARRRASARRIPSSTAVSSKPRNRAAGAPKLAARGDIDHRRANDRDEHPSTAVSRPQQHRARQAMRHRTAASRATNPPAASDQTAESDDFAAHPTGSPAEPGPIGNLRPPQVQHGSRQAREADDDGGDRDGTASRVPASSSASAATNMPIDICVSTSMNTSGKWACAGRSVSSTAARRRAAARGA